MLNILLLDDEKIILDKLEAIINSNYPDITVFRAQNGEDVASLFQKNNLVIDLMFVDIALDNESGITLATSAVTKYPDIQIVFVSANTHKSGDVYEIADNVNFIKKPIDEFYIRFYIDSLLNKKNAQSKTFDFKISHNNYSIPMEKILYFESVKNIVIIHTITSSIKARMKLNDFEKNLSNMFVRCHQSFIINICGVSIIKSNELIMNNGEVIPISRSRLNDTKEKYFSYKGGLM